MMKKRAVKKNIQQACIVHQQELIASYKKRETELYDDTFLLNSTLSQTEDRKA